MDILRAAFTGKQDDNAHREMYSDLHVSSHGSDTTPHRSSPPRHMILLFRALQFTVYILAFWGLVAIGLQPAWRGSFQASRVHGAQPKPPSCPSATTYQPDVYRPETLAKGLNQCDCGDTIREALSRDCIYDSLSAGWLPPYCRDNVLTAEFERAGPNPDGSWSFYADADGRVPLNKTQIGELGETGGSFWASRDWHVVHCLFYWQKYNRMRETGVIMEERFDSLHHVKHCSRLIRNEAPEHVVLLKVDVRMNSKKD